MRRWVSKIERALGKRRNLASELDEEIDAHLRFMIEENLERGMAPEEARAAARRQFGNMAVVRERTYESWQFPRFETFLQDLRYALRGMAKAPAFSLLVILTLAVGIGANTAIFSFVNAVLLRPLPYPYADRLEILWSGLGYSGRAPFSSFELFELRRRSTQFDQLAGTWVTNGALPGEGPAEQIKVADVTSNFLPLLCSRVVLGRFFGAEEDVENAPSTIILTHGVWARRFGSDPTIIGRSVRFGRHRSTVIGVLPADFRLIFPDDASVPPNVEVFESIPVGPWQPDGPSFLHVVGRLRNGATLAAALSEMDSAAAQINKLGGRASLGNFTVSVIPLQTDTVREVRPTLLCLFGGVGLVLLIGCANVANLLMARARRRLRETTIRAALGASRGRLARQFLTESLVLGVLGSLAALAVGYAAIHAILAARPPSFVNFDHVPLDARVLGFTFAVALGISALFGLAPVLSIRRIDLTRDLRESCRQSAGSRRPWTAALVSAEVALAFVLLTCTGLLMRTFINILHADPGFRAGNVFTFRVSVPGYAPLHLLQQKLAALPGVQSASAISHLPLDDAGNWYDYYYREGASAAEQTSVMADHRSTLPGYFTAVGATLLEGRDFTDSDDARHQHIAIIDDVLARQLWPGQSSIGQKINLSDSPPGFYQFQRDWAVVVGVVHHVQYHSLTAIVRPQIYVPYPLAPRPSMSFVLRTSGTDSSLAAEVRNTVSAVSKDIPITHVEPMQVLVDRAHSESRFASLLAILLSLIALVLATSGIYAVLSYSVAQRTTEIGIRMAIGAPRAQVLRMILADAFVWIVPGVLAGALLCLAVTPLLAHLLYGVQPTNLANYAAMLLGIIVVSALAAFLPARRAMKIDPLTALRYE
ncbi:MAG TPA: ABC transporter permease [Acidobacteriaceae bacterium]|nr:ABC transporter permease [Acidobacteriaceae bacterium]